MLLVCVLNLTVFYAVSIYVCVCVYVCVCMCTLFIVSNAIIHIRDKLLTNFSLTDTLSQ